MWIPNFPNLLPTKEELPEGLLKSKYFYNAIMYTGAWFILGGWRQNQLSDSLPYSDNNLIDNELLNTTGSYLADGSLACFLLSAANIYLPRVYNLFKRKGILVKDGLYALTRNPLYLATRGWVTGHLIENPTVGSAIGASLVYLFSELTVRYEEKILEKEWGDEYLVYKEEVPRWIPRPKNIKNALGDLREWLSREPEILENRIDFKYMAPIS